MALARKDKKYKARHVICDFCSAVNKHYSYTCRENPKNQCSVCQSKLHTSIMCPNKPRRPIKHESDKALKRRTQTRREWFELNPPNSKGLWYCYLRIAPECPYYLTRSTLTLEHVKSKARHPELRYEVSNIKPACSFCNEKKRSLDLEELPKLNPTAMAESIRELQAIQSIQVQ